MLDLSSNIEKKLSKEFETKGFVKEKIPNKIFKEIERIFINFIKKEIKLTDKLFEQLMGKKPEFRFKFIQDNANFIRQIDT